MGHGEATIIQCPVDEAGNGGEISIFDLGSIVKYYETWDVAKLLTQGQKIRYMFMTHADEEMFNRYRRGLETCPQAKTS